MRRDMDKVLCERPRCGARFKRRSRYRGPLEDAPHYESSSRRRGGNKHLNEHLGPLRRWLLSNVGRPWDKIYSELRANISPRNAVQMHIWQHAEQYVARHVVMQGRTPMHRPGQWWSVGGNPVDARRCPVYVCPKTGLLRRTPTRAKEKRSPLP